MTNQSNTINIDLNKDGVQKYPINIIKPAGTTPSLLNNSISPNTTYWGSGGYLEIWHTTGYVHYKVVLYDTEANWFTGYMRIRNVTHGYDVANRVVTGFSGSVFYFPPKGNIFSASLTGEAFFWTDPVANTAWNYYLWKD
ncbi:hypothetical protein E4665_11595 [Sporolactobacillus shoreae]|uniref:Uncharacterized protein n=1 Tax=Sporolactobacillus shoreae TaxID=1465501 RepID=A0A4Z0GLY2_9BACL|nr:hypothetical protein [Sporolactobacillus shoreae]TGA97486.1 hypothetical protein E4665_11595 [Sporolactobacillus shoreae]